MWKNFIDFQKKKLFLEKSQLFFTSNVHKIPVIKKISLNSLPKASKNLKNLLLCLSGLQLILNKRGFLLLTKTPNIRFKLQKGFPIGCKITINGKNKKLFLAFFSFYVLSQLDLVNFFFYNEKGYNVHFSLKSHQFLKRLSLVFSFFQKLPDFQINFQSSAKKEKKTILWRLLKFPLNSTIKTKNKYLN